MKINLELSGGWGPFSTGVDATVEGEGIQKRWRFMEFYGYPMPAKDKEFWDLLQHLQAAPICPWVCVGDFNKILDQHEKFGSQAQAQWQMEAFRLCLEDCGNLIWFILLLSVSGWIGHARTSGGHRCFLKPGLYMRQWLARITTR
ncbi:UNVERIFIED_CONTAM: hypothetical protein Sradi_3609600 [Sesamum radiatum]|uniref:Uncharacterized protein n=1 Tax=Sesamum radiatum TaxID=300843 RepID=A0AAW2QI00_SESRA